MCLQKKEYSVSTNLIIGSGDSYVDTSQSKRTSNTTVLPLSLENNSTLAGTGAILDQFASEFSIPRSCKLENLPFDKNSKMFSLKQAREHVEFVALMNCHTKHGQDYINQLNVVEQNEDTVSVEDIESGQDDHDDHYDSDDDDLSADRSTCMHSR